MLFATAIATLDTTMTAIDWTRNALIEGLTSLGYWQNANSRRAIAFLESDHFHQFIRHTAQAWVIFCTMVRFVAAMLTPSNPVLISASDEVVNVMAATNHDVMDMDLGDINAIAAFNARFDIAPHSIQLSTFTANDWPDSAEQDLALLNGWS